MKSIYTVFIIINAPHPPAIFSKIFNFINSSLLLWICLDKTVLMMGHKICFYGEIWLIIPKLSLLTFLSGAIIKLLYQELLFLFQFIYLLLLSYLFIHFFYYFFPIFFAMYFRILSKIFYVSKGWQKLECSYKEHTCDKFQRGIREVFLSFPGGF